MLRSQGSLMVSFTFGNMDAFVYWKIKIWTWKSETWIYIRNLNLWSLILKMWTSKTWTFEVLISETWGSEVWTFETWAFEAWTFESWGSKDWTSETFESCNLTCKILLAIPKTWSVTFETWKFVGETRLEVFAFTISAFVFTSFGRHLILGVYVMWTLGFWHAPCLARLIHFFHGFGCLG